MDLIERLRREADISARPGQMDRLNALADEFAAALEAAHADITEYQRNLSAESAARVAAEDALEAAREDAWQLIETAPKDAVSRILLLLKDGRVVTGRGWFRSLMGPEKLGGGRETIGKEFAGYCEEEGSAWMPRSPTHWMPLPAPPAIDQARGKGVDGG